MSWTRIVGVEGELADHLTTTTAQLSNFFKLTRVVLVFIKGGGIGWEILQNLFGHGQDPLNKFHRKLNTLLGLIKKWPTNQIA